MTKEEMLAEYEVIGFAYGLCVVRRKSDGVEGTLEFSRDEESNERRYFGFRGVSNA